MSNSPLRPFASAAAAMVQFGVTPLPLGGDDGKRPLVRYRRWRNPPKAAALAKLVDRFPGANVGAVCCASGLVIVDVDDSTIAAYVQAKLPPTPLVVGTPKGGRHLYYGNSEGVGCLNLRSAGLQVDVKGNGGIIACPPSVNPTTGLAYTFLSGGWSNVPNLPVLTQRSLRALARRTDPDALSGSNPVGTRNDRLFAHLRSLAPWSSLDEIIGEARWYNCNQNSQPEPDAGVVATARQVWRYQEAGTLRPPTSGFIKLNTTALDALRGAAGRDYPTALAMHVDILRQHGARSARGETFALAATAMSEAQSTTGVRDRRRYERARTALLTAGLIREIEPTRRLANGTMAPARYQLAQPSAKTAQDVPDIPPRMRSVDTREET